MIEGLPLLGCRHLLVLPELGGRDREAGIELTVVVTADADRELFRLLAYFTAKGTHEQALAFCNRFNMGLVMARAQVLDEPNSEGEWVVIIDHDRLVFEEERLDPRTIVKLTRRFQYVVRNGMSRCDTDGIF